MSRSRDFDGLADNWDPLQEDYNDSFYGSQDPDDDSRDGVQLDHTRLYIRNIPAGLNQTGLQSVFSKYGSPTNVFISNNPQKRFALVKYETAGEAKLAMMKLNKTQPLNLMINIAHKENKAPKQQDKRRPAPAQRKVTSQASEEKRGGRGEAYDDESVSSRGHRSEKSRMQHPIDDFYVKDLELEDLDPDLELKLERVRLEQAQIYYEQRIRAVQQAERKIAAESSGRVSRSITADGRIVVRNDLDRTYENKPPAMNGGSDTPPGLQRSAARACVQCGARADAYCARCGVTPYCSERCQRSDWPRRHRSVCHNLMRDEEAMKSEADDVPDVQHAEPVITPLRRPRSPSTKKPNDVDVIKKSTSAQSNNDKQSQRSNNSFESKPFANKSKIQNRIANAQEEKHVVKESPPKPQPKPFSKTDMSFNKPKTDTQSETIQKPEEPKPFKRHINQVPKRHEAPVESKKVPEVSPKVPKCKEVQVPRMAKMMAKFKGVGGKSDAEEGGETMVPEKCLIDLLDVQSTVILSVDSSSNSCKIDKGFVCLSLHESKEREYGELCERYQAECEREGDISPTPGEVFSLFVPEDAGWYRARMLSATEAAILDAAKVVPVGGEAGRRPLCGEWRHVAEFSCVLVAEAVKLGDQLKATIVSRSEGVCKVTLSDFEGRSLGDGELMRWRPKVDVPQKTEPGAGQKTDIPSVPRPELKNRQRVVIVDASSTLVAVREAGEGPRRQHDVAEQGVALYGTTASPLLEPPSSGDLVAALFDGAHYRALCRRTSRAKNKYLVEYVEYGNEEVTSLEQLFPCPPEFDLERAPCVTSRVHLGLKGLTLTKEALEYLSGLRDMEAVLTLPAAESAPSGSVATLTLVKNNENVNTRVEEMCKPGWKRLEERNKSVLDSKSLYLADLTYIPLPGRGRLRILDASLLGAGSLSVCAEGADAERQIERVNGPLAEMMAEYCNSEIGREPYCPREEELCIAKCPPYDQWFRASCIRDESQPRSAATATVLYVDYGNVGTVDVSNVKKIMPEFVNGEPAVANLLEIEGLPEKLSKEALQKAREYLNIESECGAIEIEDCVKESVGCYKGRAPGLLAALRGLI